MKCGPFDSSLDPDAQCRNAFEQLFQLRRRGCPRNAYQVHRRQGVPRQPERFAQPSASSDYAERRRQFGVKRSVLAGGDPIRLRHRTVRSKGPMRSCERRTRARIRLRKRRTCFGNRLEVISIGTAVQHLTRDCKKLCGAPPALRLWFDLGISRWCIEKHRVAGPRFG